MDEAEMSKRLFDLSTRVESIGISLVNARSKIMALIAEIQELREAI